MGTDGREQPPEEPMSTDRREHLLWWPHQISQDGRHLGRHAWLTLCQWVRAHAVVPDRLPRLWRRPPLGYLVAARAVRMAQAATERYAQIYASERQQREKVETAVRMRDDILNLATHDLRSPATSVLSRAQLVQQRLHRGLALDAAWLDAQMQAIGAAIACLNATIDEMSDVARLQVGQALDLQLEDLDVRALVRAAAAGSRAIVEQHHGHITVASAVGQGTTVTVCLPRSADEGNPL